MTRIQRIAGGALCLLLAASSARAGDPSFREIQRNGDDYVRVTQIGETPVYEVNSHHWALYAWILAAHDEPARFASPLTLVHVDSHSDMQDGTFGLLGREEAIAHPGRFYEQLLKYQERPTESGMHIDSYISPSLSLFPIEKILWLRPDFAANSPEAGSGSYAIDWARTTKGADSGSFFSSLDVPIFDQLFSHIPAREPSSFERRLSWFTTHGYAVETTGRLTLDITQIEEAIHLEGPYILDIDMDSFSCHNAAGNPALPNHLAAGPKEIGERVTDLVKSLRRQAGRPVAITIATSEGVRAKSASGIFPRNGAFTPPEDVLIIRENLLRELTEWLSSFNSAS